MISRAECQHRLCVVLPRAAAEGRLVDSLAAALLAAAAASSPRAAARHAVRSCLSHPAHTPLVFRALAQLPAVCRARCSGDGGGGEGDPAAAVDPSARLFPSALLAELSAAVACDGRGGLFESQAAGGAVVRLCALLLCGAAKGCSLAGSAPSTTTAGISTTGGAGARGVPLLDPGELVAWVALPAMRPDYPGSAVSVAVRLAIVAVSEYAAEGAARGLPFPPARRVRSSIYTPASVSSELALALEGRVSASRERNVCVKSHPFSTQGGAALGESALVVTHPPAHLCPAAVPRGGRRRLPPGPAAAVDLPGPCANRDW